MASYLTKKIICPCCSREFEGKILKGFFQNSVMGLDRNPHTPAIYDTITICPHCGYASTNMNKPVADSIKLFVHSPSYWELKKRLIHDNVLSKIILSAVIFEESFNFKAAADTYLLGYWYSLDSNARNNEYLSKAIQYYSIYLENNEDIETAIALIDCSRQAGNFDEAKETAESLIPYIDNAQLQRIISYELKLIQKNDDAAHLVSEALL